jgi:hypothetical protein
MSNRKNVKPASPLPVVSNSDDVPRDAAGRRLSATRSAIMKGN